MSLIHPNCRHAPGGPDSKNTSVIKQKMAPEAVLE
jgi:hypothetical protein